MRTECSRRASASSVWRACLPSSDAADDPAVAAGCVDAALYTAGCGDTVAGGCGVTVAGGCGVTLGGGAAGGGDVPSDGADCAAAGVAAVKPVATMATTSARTTRIGGV